MPETFYISPELTPQELAMLQTGGSGSSSSGSRCSENSGGLGSCCGPDVTEWYIQQLNLIKPFSQTLTIGSSKYKKFWSTIKFEEANLVSEKCPKGNCKDHITICGYCIHVTELGNIAYGYAAGRGYDPIFGMKANSGPIMLWGGFYADIVKGRGFTNKKEIASALAGQILNAHLDAKGSNFCELMTKPKICQEERIKEIISNVASIERLNFLRTGRRILTEWNVKHQKAAGTWNECLREAINIRGKQGGSLHANRNEKCNCCSSKPTSPKSIKPNSETGVVSWESS